MRRFVLMLVLLVGLAMPVSVGAVSLLALHTIVNYGSITNYCGAAISGLEPVTYGDGTLTYLPCATLLIIDGCDTGVLDPDDYGDQISDLADGAQKPWSVCQQRISPDKWMEEGRPEYW